MERGSCLSRRMLITKLQIYFPETSMVQISDKFEPCFSKNPTFTNGYCRVSWNHQDTNTKAALTQATFPLQRSYVSKLCVSSHANISVLLLSSWQLENTQKPNSQFCSREHKLGGYLCRRLVETSLLYSTRAALLGCSWLVIFWVNSRAWYFNSPKPQGLYRPQVFCMLRVLWQKPWLPPPVSQLALFDASKQLFFFNLTSLWESFWFSI